MTKKAARIALPLLFTLLTPFGVDAQWIQVGPYNYRVYPIATSGTTLYVGTTFIGNSATSPCVFCSTNSGTSWVAAGMMKWGANALAVSGATVFAGGGIGGVYRSTDSGANWDSVGTGLTDTTDPYPYGGIPAVSSFCATGENLFAGAFHGGVFLSTDNGANWTTVNRGLPRWDPPYPPVITSIFGLTFIGQNLFAGTDHGVYMSTNMGSSWSAVYMGSTNPWTSSLAVLGTNLFAATRGGVFRSTDTGTNWLLANAGLPDAVVTFAVSGANIFAGTNTDGIFRSTDNGTSWTAANTGLTIGSIGALAVIGTDLFATTSDGVFRSKDSGMTWSSANVGLWNDAKEVTTLSGCGKYLLVHDVLGECNFISTDHGIQWSAIHSGIAHIMPNASVFAISGTSLFAGGGFGTGVNRSTDGGITWSPVDSGLANTDVGSLAVSGANLFAGTAGGVFLSSNDGTNWTTAGLTGSTVAALAVSGIYLIASTYSVYPDGFSHNWALHRSTDSGKSWTTDNSLAISSIVVSGTNLFAVGNSAILMSTDNGISWTEVISGLEYSGAGHLAVNGTNVLIGTGIEVLLSTNSGASWSTPNTTIWDAQAFALDDKYLYAGTRIGVWREALSAMTDVSTSATERPTIFKLEQNYPNPFNPATTIRYALPARSHVTLTVFNTLGQQVANLFDGVEEPGERSVRFDGSGLASGVYFYRLRAGEYVETKKLVLIR